MKAFGTVLKILAALAAIAGIIYVVATYGDKMVAWARNLMNRNKKPIFTYTTSYGEPVGDVEDAELAADADFEG
jgi:hypothetical protein